MDAHTPCRTSFLVCAVLSFIALHPRSCASADSAISTERHAGNLTLDWPMVGGSLDNTRYSAIAQLNTKNVKALGAIWISEKFHDGATSTATPVMEAGVMYITAGRRVYAIDAKTGRTRWDYTPVSNVRQTNESEATLISAAPNSRGVAVGQGLVFVGLMNGYVIALKQETGELVWSVQTGADEENVLQAATAAPTYTNGVVLIGLSGGDLNLRGRMTAIDAQTGRKLWQLFTIPGPGEPGHETWPSFNDIWKFGGGGAWTNVAVDPELGLAYFTTGNPVPAYAGDLRPGDNLYTCSLLAVDVRTGKLRWHYQLVRHDIFEADAGTPAILYDAHVRGGNQKAIAVMRSDGHLFQLDRVTGKPLLAVEERPVPQLRSQASESVTQPFPVDGESILMSCDEWRKKKIPAGFRVGCMWTPPAAPPPSEDPPNVLAPFPSVRISTMAYSPQTRYFYAQGQSYLTWPRRSQDPFLLVFDLTVLNLQSYAHLAAIDSQSGRIAWKVPIYTKGNQFHYLKGGTLATAGGLVFRGSGDGNVEAYNSKTGEVLWKFQTGNFDRNGPPISYEIDGQQYVALSMGSAVWAFNLTGKLPAASTPTATPPQEDPFTAPIMDAQIIEAVSLKQQIFGAGTRSFVDEFQFSPPRARVVPRTKVMFVNNGNLRHEMVALDGAWTTGPLSPTQKAWLTFDTPGRYTYICKDHPWTYGQVIVDPVEPPEIQQRRSSSSEGGTFKDSAARVANGRSVYKRHCSACHGEHLEGLSIAPALSGSTFSAHWNGMKVSDLFDRIRTTMPPMAPGSLDTQWYLDLVSYLLQTSEGSREMDIPDDPNALNNMIIGKLGDSTAH